MIIGKLAEALGAKLLTHFYIFGDYGGLVILEMLDDTSVEAFRLGARLDRSEIRASAAGHLRDTRITKLLTLDEVVAAKRKAGGVSYRGPAAS